MYWKEYLPFILTFSREMPRESRKRYSPSTSVSLRVISLHFQPNSGLFILQPENSIFVHSLRNFTQFILQFVYLPSKLYQRGALAVSSKLESETVCPLACQRGYLRENTQLLIFTSEHSLSALSPSASPKKIQSSTSADTR